MNNAITKKDIISIIKKTKSSLVFEKEKEKESDKIRKILREIAKFLLKSKLKCTFKNQKIYESGNLHKYWCIDFLEYILEKKDIYFNLEYFNENDKTEIKKFIKNKIKIAIGNKYIPKEELFDKTDFKYMKKYKEYKNKSIIITKKDIKVHCCNKEYIIPKRYNYKVKAAFYYHELGLKELPTKVKEKLKYTDFIDGGSYIGDSIIILDNLNPKKIVSLEPDADNFNKLLEMIKINRFNAEIIALKKGLDEIERKINFFSGLDTISGSYEKTKSKNMITIETTTIDKIVKEFDLNLGLIKLDIEGLELEAIKGAVESIQKFKPVLIVSLYHTGKDFFEIPPLLKKIVPEYKFRFLNLYRTSPFTERILLAWKE